MGAATGSKLVGAVMVVAAVTGACASSRGSVVADAPPAPTASAPAAPAPTTTTVAVTTTGRAPESTPAAPASPPPAPTTVAPPRTRCRDVVHIGDSITLGAVSEMMAPEVRLDAQYARVGVERASFDASGGRSVVETLPDQVNALDAVVAARPPGRAVCWVLQIGTNDAANIAAGSGIDASTRIERMLAATAPDPVLWVDATSRVDAGDYARANMDRWNGALAAAAANHRELRVFAWSAQARDEWFQRDGVHYTNDGYVWFARSLADALAAAFPA